MFKNSSILFISIFAFLIAGCNNEKAEAINSIIEDSIYRGKYENFTYEITPQWKKYEILKKSSEAELVKLCEHEISIIRCYAFQALTDTCSSKVYDVLMKHIFDTSEYYGQFGCFSQNARVSDFFLDCVGYDKKMRSRFTLTEGQYNHIDSLLLYGKDITERNPRYDCLVYTSRADLLERIEPRPQYYNRIREIVATGTFEALPALAKFRNIDDTSVIKDILKNVDFDMEKRRANHYFENSVINFPNPVFYPILKKNLLDKLDGKNNYNRLPSRLLYQALAQYTNLDTKKLFEDALESTDVELIVHSQAMYRALQKYPSPIFDEVFKKAFKNIPVEYLESDY